MSSGPELPSGTVTFLFTDIEGSTRLVKALGDRYEQVLAEHQGILRRAFAEYSGHEVDTQGDSFFVAFRRAGDAIACAVAAQRALTEHDWPEGTAVKVRMGIHTGEPVVGEQRYTGIGVHRAARIGAVGHGGQILISNATRELIEDDLPQQIALRDLGRHRLKDIQRPERIYQVAAEGLPWKFPPLKSAGQTGWRRRRTLVLVGVAALAAGASAVALVAVGGSETASATSVAPNAVGVIDAGSGDISRQIPVGLAPKAVAATPKAVWVVNTDGNSVSRLDPETNAVRQTVPVGGGPDGVAVGGGAVWVANGLDGTVSRVDPTTEPNQVVQTKQVGNGPSAIAYGAGAVWVANSSDGTVTKIDPSTGDVVRILPAIAGPRAIAVGFGLVWVASPSAGRVIALDPKSGSQQLSVGVGGDPSAIAVGESSIWVANRAGATVSEIEPRNGVVTATIPVGNAPSGIAAAGGAVWVANSADGTLSRIDPRRAAVVKTVRLKNPPQGIDVLGTQVYVAVRSTGAEHRGGMLSVLVPEGPDSIDPAISYSPVGWATLVLTSDGLVGFRRVGGVEGSELVPDLAVSLPTPTDGGRTYTFRLRDGIRYSDGRAVQPEDFRRALERDFEISPPSPGTPYYGGIVGASACRPKKPCDLSHGIAVDSTARTVTYHLVAPDPEFLDKLALPFAFAVPAGTPAHDIGGRALPATGPYRIASYTRQSLRLVRNSMFREWSADAQPAGYPDSIVFRFPIPLGEEIKMVERGHGDIAPSVESAPPADLDRLTTLFRSQLHVSTREATHYVSLNTRIPPFDNVDARRALLAASDPRTAFGQQSLARSPTCQILPPNMPGFRPHACRPSLAAARALVRKSGTRGAQVVVWTAGPFVDGSRYVVTLLRELGYDARLKIFPLTGPSGLGAYFDAVADSRQRVQAAGAGWLADFPSAGGFLSPLFTCAAFTPGAPHATTNSSEFCDRRIDALIQHATEVQAENPPAASLLWPKVETAILDRAPIIPLWNPRTIDAVSKRLGNYQLNPQWGFLVDQAWVK